MSNCGTSRSGDPFAIMDGTYVLGVLDPAERAEFEAHLQTCGECRARVGEVAPLPDLLALVRAEVAAGDTPPANDPVPETLLPGLLRRAGRERRRRRVVIGALGAAVAACVLSLVVVLWPAGGSSGPAPQALRPVATSPVHATARLEARTWGTQIDLHCTYDYGVSTGAPYDLRVYDRNGAPHDAGSWRLVPGEVTKWSGGTSVPRDQISRIQVLGPKGQPILQLTL